MTCRNIITNFSLIGLRKAAESYGVPINMLLEAARDEKLELLFEIPPWQLVVLKQHKYVSDFKDASVGLIDRESTPEYLVLHPELCSQLLRKPSVQCCESDVGYRGIAPGPSGEAHLLQKLCAAAMVSEGRSPIMVQADGNVCTREKNWTRWVLYSDGKEVPMKVQIDDLFFRDESFRAWLKIGIDGKPNGEYFLINQKNDDDVEDDFKSPQLLRMCEAAIKLWASESVIPSDPSTHPTNQLVVKWLLESGTGFTKTSAENAASLIKPVFGLRAGAPEKKK